jgi:hypothetical protein
VLGGNCTVDETCDPATSGQSEAEQLFLGKHATQRRLEDFSEDRWGWSRVTMAIWWQHVDSGDDDEGGIHLLLLLLIIMKRVKVMMMTMMVLSAVCLGSYARGNYDDFSNGLPSTNLFQGEIVAFCQAAAGEDLTKCSNGTIFRAALKEVHGGATRSLSPPSELLLATGACACLTVAPLSGHVCACSVTAPLLTRWCGGGSTSTPRTATGSRSTAGRWIRSSGTWSTRC